MGMEINSTTSNLPSPNINEECKGHVTINEIKTCSPEPIKIILFPPENKQFGYDASSNSFYVEAVKIPKDESLTQKNDSYSTNANEHSNLSSGPSGLTPLVDTCMILQEGNNIPTSEKAQFNWNYTIREVHKIEKIFKETKLKWKCFLKGCKWSPDGLCLLTNSDDNVLRLFETPQFISGASEDETLPILQMKEGGTIYDYEWYPQMNSSDPLSCVFVSASQGAPIHMWDAYSGCLRATYQPINQFDEVTPAYSVAFSPDGSKLYSGYKKVLRIFNVSYPGKVSEERLLKVKGNLISQANIVSTICVNKAIPNLYAIGCYDKTIGLYCEPEGDLLFILQGHSGGVTQVKFSQDGHYLFSGGRKDYEILCWDIRNPGKVLFSICRKIDTQQKMQFDISPDNTHLITGTTDCKIKLYNLKKPPNSENVLESVETWKGHSDCVNGVQFHPKVSLFASTSGQRHFLSIDTEEESEEDDIMWAEDRNIENSLKIWSFIAP